MRLKTIFPILLLLAGRVAILPAATVAPEKESARPLQPFLVELLDQERGSWNFLNPLGQQLEHSGEVTVVAAVAPEKAKAVVLRLDNPEFPGDATRAEFREFPAAKPGYFELRVGGFQADLSLKPDGMGTLSNIRLGSAVQADRIPAALYVSDGSQMIPIRLEGKSGGLKLQSDRVGSVFVGDEPVKLHAVRLGGGTPVEAEYIITDYFRNREIGRGKVRLDGEDTVFPVPLEKFGSFTVKLKLPERSASLRVTHIPEPQKLDPERSFVGMNIFQQQMWYYSYQLPLFAQAGVRWIRPWLHWENTWKMQEPKAGVFDTTQLDALLRRLKGHDQKLVYILYNFSPSLGLPSTEKSPLNDEQMKHWQKYVKRIVTHCGDVNDWEVWNEPDLLANNSGFTAKFYKRLLLDTAKAIREVRPNARVHSLSHALQHPWLEEICGDMESAEATDVVTLHSYISYPIFSVSEMPRQRILDFGGFCGKPQQFNEIGTSGYDGCPEYSNTFQGTSERLQAEALPILWAQALHFGGPQGKAYWFCSLDPRDSNNLKQRTGDSSIGLLYLGLQPKTAYAALAGMADMLDGNECLGLLNIPHSQVRCAAFSNDRAVVWSDTGKETITATQLGCLPGEVLTVRDLFGNEMQKGKAETLTLNLDDGPRFLLGSKQLGELADATRKTWMQDRARRAEAERQVGTPSLPQLKTGETRTFEFPIPEKSKVTWTISREFPGKLGIRQKGALVQGEITAGNKSDAGVVSFAIRLPLSSAPVVTRLLPVSVARRDFISDRAFLRGNLDEYVLVPGVSMESSEGASAPGCMRLDSSFDKRLHLYVKRPLLPKQALHFQVTMKGKLSSAAEVSFCVAMFSNGNQWAGTWMAASLRDNSPETKQFQEFTEEIPPKFRHWTTIMATLPEDRLPKGKTTLIFFIDAKNWKTGDYLLVDDIMIYQQENESKTAAGKPAEY